MDIGRLKSSLLARFPPVAHAIAYGSAVLPQSGRSPGRLLDLLLCVPSPHQWHIDNLSSNPSDYSWLSRSLGPRFASFLQEAGPGGIYFNADAILDGSRIKYGVISVGRACQDLSSWRDLYFAGRLQKPVLDIISDNEINHLNETVNRPAALLYALITSGKRMVEWREVFERIVGLSYSGDIRMWLAEDNRKVQRVVSGQYDRLLGIYRPIAYNCGLGVTDTGIIAHDKAMSPIRWEYPKTRVFMSSITQALKGLITTSPGTASMYLWEKVKKKLNM